MTSDPSAPSFLVNDKMQMIYTLEGQLNQRDVKMSSEIQTLTSLPHPGYTQMEWSASRKYISLLWPTNDSYVILETLSWKTIAGGSGHSICWAAHSDTFALLEIVSRNFPLVSIAEQDTKKKKKKKDERPSLPPDIVVSIRIIKENRFL